jgi:uncharacterized protein
MATLRALYLSLALLLASTGGAAEQFTPPYLTGPVMDEVGLLDGGARSRIEGVIRSMHEQGRAQMTVYIPSSLHDLPIEELSIRVAEAWKLGLKKGDRRDRGLLLVVAPNERKMRFEVGYGLEDELTDAYTRQLLDDVLRPYFREQRYGDGILAVVGQIASRLGVNEASVDAPPPPQAAYGRTLSTGEVMVLMIILVPFLIFFFILRFISGLGMRRRHRGIFWGGGGWGGGGFGGWGGGGGWSGGGGGFGGGGSSSSW